MVLQLSTLQVPDCSSTDLPCRLGRESSTKPLWQPHRGRKLLVGCFVKLVFVAVWCLVSPRGTGQQLQPRAYSVSPVGRTSSFFLMAEPPGTCRLTRRCRLKTPRPVSAPPAWAIFGPSTFWADRPMSPWPFHTCGVRRKAGWRVSFRQLHAQDFLIRASGLASPSLRISRVVSALCPASRAPNLIFVLDVEIAGGRGLPAGHSAVLSGRSATGTHKRDSTATGRRQMERLRRTELRTIRNNLAQLRASDGERLESFTPPPAVTRQGPSARSHTVVERAERRLRGSSRITRLTTVYIKTS